MTNSRPGVPMLWNQCIDIELPNGHFVRVDTTDRGNECGNEIRIEHLDETGEYQSAIIVFPE